MDYMKIIWLSALIVFAVAEALTTQMVCIWFAASALITLVSALFGAPPGIQLSMFITVTALLLISTRPLARRILKKPLSRTNADRAVGMTAVVTEDIDNEAPRGLAKVLGQTWSARSVSGETIPAGTKVVVRSIEGVKLMVDAVCDDYTNIKEAAQCQ